MTASVRLALLAATAVCAAHSVSAAGPLDRIMSAGSAQRELGQVLDSVRAATKAGRKPVVIFDIDDTVIRWHKKDGVKTHYSPMPGAARYLRALDKAGAQLVYLTARGEVDDAGKSRRPETMEALRRARVPMGDKHPVMMNPHPMGYPAAKWKAEALPAIRARGVTIAAFDNDLSNVRMFRQKLRGAAVFRVAGHSSSTDPAVRRGTDGIRVIGDYTTFRSRRVSASRLPRIKSVVHAPRKLNRPVRRGPTKAQRPVRARPIRGR